uniref:Uncharacterized protein n=1 Tax=Ascaris lumbricoides TaxID=6252 RepID=A0A0M3HKG8_ASCLU
MVFISTNHLHQLLSLTLRLSIIEDTELLSIIQPMDVFSSI